MRTSLVTKPVQKTGKLSPPYSSQGQHLVLQRPACLCFYLCSLLHFVSILNLSLKDNHRLHSEVFKVLTIYSKSTFGDKKFKLNFDLNIKETQSNYLLRFLSVELYYKPVLTVVSV